MTPYPIHPLIPLGIVVGMLAGLALVLVILNWREPVYYPIGPQSSHAAIGLGIALLIVAVAVLLFGKL